MLQVLQKELTRLGAFKEQMPDIINRVVEAIPYQTVPLRMKQTIAASEVILFASQFRRNIHHWDGGEVPINTISLIMTGSGNNKDSSVASARKCFGAGYDMINEKRKQIAKDTAKALASEAGEDMPYKWEVCKKYYRAPNPLFVAPSTPEGFIQHLNDLDNDGIGSGFIYSGEVGAELSQSPLLVENIKVLSELYDMGNKEVKALKARENQSKEIKGLPVSALFVGSPDNILYDEQTKKKVKVELLTKLARRTNVCFVPELIPEPTYDNDINKLVDAEINNDDESIAARMQISEGIKVITEHHLANNTSLQIDANVRRLFIIYKRYNTEISNNTPKLYPASALVRKHLQWKALKLSGALAMFENSDTITEDHYIQAIRFTEILDKDMQLFERELVKEQYEVFADYMKSTLENGTSSISLHSLRKHGFIPTAGQPDAKMRDLVHLAASYDPSGVYTVKDNALIEYEQIVQTDKLGISYKAIDMAPLNKLVESNGSKEAISTAKQNIAKTLSYGFEYASTEFAELSKLLEQDMAYSPFQFKDGVRSKDTLIPKTKTLVLDIDDSNITATEFHYILQDINHHIALSSDPTNEFKFRLLIELDSEVELNPIEWKHFYTSIATDLAIKVDSLPQSQIFYSYAGRPIYSVTDKAPIEVRDHIMLAKDQAAMRTPLTEKKLTKAQQKALLDNELDTFYKAFEAEDGKGSLALRNAGLDAMKLGMTPDEAVELIHRINNYWVNPLEATRLQTTIINPLLRKYK